MAIEGLPTGQAELEFTENLLLKAAGAAGMELGKLRVLLVALRHSDRSRYDQVMGILQSEDPTPHDLTFVRQLLTGSNSLTND